MWKDIQAVLGDMEAPRMEVYHYCDIAAGREVLKASPESIAYLPCRIAIMEDANKQLWVITLDWEMAWLDTVNGKMGIDAELVETRQGHSRKDGQHHAGRCEWRSVIPLHPPTHEGALP
jgi:uncharacterized protein (DUF302 family)